MNRHPVFERRVPVIGLWLLILVLSITVILHTRFTADMSAFLPSNPTPEQAFLVDQIKNGAISRMILIGIEGGDARTRAEASKALGTTLRQSELFTLVRNGNAPTRSADEALLFDHRYLLSPAVTAQQFSPTGLHDAIANGIDLLASPFGLFSQKIFTRDPTGETFTIVNQLGQDHAPRSQNGAWVSPTSARALLMLQTRDAGADTDAMAKALAQVHADFAALITSNPAMAPLRLMVSGAPVFSVDSRRLIKADVERFSIIGSVAIMLLLLLVYRSVSLLVLGLLPVLTGIAVAIATVSLGFGTVHGITIGFGTTLIGEAIDYSIYYFIQTQNESEHDNPTTGMERFWPTIRLGVLTSVTGFAALLFSGFPGLAQIGLYSIAGLLTAALVTRFVLPHLGTARLNRHSLAGLGRGLAPVFRGLQLLRWGFVVLALAGVVLLIARHGSIWQTGLSGLSPISAQAKAVDDELRADMSAGDARYFIATTAQTQQAALVAAERLDAALTPLVEQGVLTSFDSPAKFLPSEATQRARQQALPDRATLTQNLHAAVEGLPIQAAKLAPFIDAVEQARQQAPLKPDDLNGTSFGLAIHALLQPQNDQWLALIRLHTPDEGALEPQHITAALTRAMAASGVPNALLIDKDTESTRLFNGYLNNTIALSLAGLLAIVVVLGFVLRSPARLLRVLLPLLIAVILVMAGLNLTGEKLNMLNLVGLLLIVAIGSNYALFFNQGKAPDHQTLASLALANLTTVIAFGTLAFSQLPILHAFGSTVAPGAILALMVSAAFAKTDQPPAAA
ncbi:MAG: MMPL family transporter [Halothiobacillus sp.]